MKINETPSPQKILSEQLSIVLEQRGQFKDEKNKLSDRLGDVNLEIIKLDTIINSFESTLKTYTKGNAI